MSRNVRPLRALVIQRQSHVSQTPFARSVAARITEALDYLFRQGRMTWEEKDENQTRGEDFDGKQVVFFNKHASLNSVEIAREAKRRGIFILYDLDDWIVDFPGYSGASRQTTPERKNCFYEHLALADGYAVANEVLYQELKKDRPDLILVPNGFFAEKYVPSLSAEGEIPRMVFSNADQLKVQRFKEDFIRLLNAFLLRHPEIELDFYGDPFPEMASIVRLNNMGSLPYDEHKRRLAARKYSFAIVPLGGREDQESLFFNSCKNPFKYLEYGGLGIPGIYSRSPIYEKVVRGGETGLLVENTLPDWEAALEKIAGDRNLREHIRRTAYRDVIENHSIRVPAGMYLQTVSGPG